LKAQFLIRALGHYYSEDNYCGRRGVTVPLEERLLYYSVHMYIVFFYFCTSLF